jgi:hypothetical protein
MSDCGWCKWRSVPVAWMIASTTRLMSAAEENLESRNMKGGGERGALAWRERQLKVMPPNGTLSASEVGEVGSVGERSISAVRDLE